MRLMLDLLTDNQLLMEELRYVSMGCGAQCVMMDGMTEMHKWCVSNWDIMDVIFFGKSIIIMTLLLTNSQCLFHCKDILFYQMHQPIIWMMLIAEDMKVC